MNSETSWLNGSIDYEGFHPTHQERWLVEAYLTKFSDKAPSRAYITSKVRFQESEYSVKVHISSFQGEFFSELNHQELQEALIRVESELNRKLLDWKKSRFEQGQGLSSLA